MSIPISGGATSFGGCSIGYGFEGADARLGFLAGRSFSTSIAVGGVADRCRLFEEPTAKEEAVRRSIASGTHSAVPRPQCPQVRKVSPT